MISIIIINAVREYSFRVPYNQNTFSSLIPFLKVSIIYCSTRFYRDTYCTVRFPVRFFEMFLPFVRESAVFEKHGA